MAKLSKNPKLQVRTPEWASFFTPGEYTDFVQIVCSTMAKNGLHAHLDDGFAVLRRPGHSDERVSLLNLAQMCRDRERAKWPLVVGEFFGTIEKTTRDPEKLVNQIQDFAAARDKIKVRLHPEDYLQHSHAVHLCLRKITDGIAALLVCDLGFANISLPAEFAKEWGKPMDELFALGVKNVRAEGRLQEARGRPTGGLSVDMLTSGSNYAASHVLFFEDYLQGGTGYGAIVGVPSREVLFRHVIRDKSVIEAMRFVHEVTQDAYKKGPGAISREIYWWRAGVLKRVPTQLVEGKFIIAPGEEFEREVFASMMKGN